LPFTRYRKGGRRRGKEGKGGERRGKEGKEEKQGETRRNEEKQFLLLPLSRTSSAKAVALSSLPTRRIGGVEGGRRERRRREEK
jgi:hypothetical protein